MTDHRQQKPAPGARFTREITIPRTAVDAEARTVELAFSSEAPVARFWGTEILDHAPSAVRLDRINAAGPLLVGHNPDDQVGVIESVSIDSDRMGRAVVRFSRGARGEEIFRDIADGIRRSVSVGYVVHKAVLQSREEDAETYRITDWEPLEISIVSVPADVSVGVGRSAESSNHNEEPAMSTAAPNAETQSAPENRAKPIEPVDIAAIEGRAREAETKRVAEILAIGEQFRTLVGADKLAAEAIRAGESIDAFRKRIMDAIDERNRRTPTPAAIGMSEGETRRYSLVRALAFLANPGDRKIREAAAFEIECSEAAVHQRGGNTPRGLLVPHDVLTRDLTVGTATAGGDTVATNLLAASFIDLLRNALLLPGMGAQMLTGLAGNIAIPRATGGATAYWVAESGAPTESQAAFDQVAMSPKTVGAFSDISRKLLLQSSIAIEQFVQNDLATALALAIQNAAIKGGGSNEPSGILSTSGIGSVAGGTNGAAPTWANIIDLETAVAAVNAAVGTLGYLTNAKVRGKLKGTEKFTGSSGTPVWGDGNTPLNGYAAGVTNAVASNGTKGTGTNLSTIIFGNFADLLIGLWGGLDVTVDPYTNSTSGTVRVVTLQDVDVAVRHPESFAAMTDAITA